VDFQSREEIRRDRAFLEHLHVWELVHNHGEQGKKVRLRSPEMIMTEALRDRRCVNNLQKKIVRDAKKIRVRPVSNISFQKHLAFTSLPPSQAVAPTN